MKALRNAGLLVDAIEEWPSHKTSTSGPRAAAENAARKEIPMFMAIRAVKVASAGARESRTRNRSNAAQRVTRFRVTRRALPCGYCPLHFPHDATDRFDQQ